jgi:transcriptional regulator with XRE-family HTH domain
MQLIGPSFAKILKDLRASRGLSQENLAARSGFAPADIAAAETEGKERQSFSSAALKRLAWALHLTEGETFGLFKTVDPGLSMFGWQYGGTHLRRTSFVAPEAYCTIRAGADAMKIADAVSQIPGVYFSACMRTVQDEARIIARASQAACAALMTNPEIAGLPADLANERSTLIQTIRVFPINAGMPGIDNMANPAQEAPLPVTNDKKQNFIFFQLFGNHAAKEIAYNINRLKRWSPGFQDIDILHAVAIQGNQPGNIITARCDVSQPFSEFKNQLTRGLSVKRQVLLRTTSDCIFNPRLFGAAASVPHRFACC